MDAASFERVYDSLQEFHAFFAASFGRKQWRDHSGNYLQALLVQDQERRNAENLSESVGISARAMQRFLTEARWSDETVIGRLQEYLAPRLGHPEAVWVFDGSDFPKQGRKSAGVARQYCGRLGKVANCQGGMFLAYVSPLGRALVDKRLYLPKSWTSDQDRCAAAGVPEDRRNSRSKTELALVLQPQILAKVFQAALVVATAGPGLMAPSPPGPGQHRFVQRHGPPDQPVQQAAHLGNRQWYQGFIPLRFSPFFPLKQALAFCRTTAR